PAHPDGRGAPGAGKRPSFDCLRGARFALHFDPRALPVTRLPQQEHTDEEPPMSNGTGVTDSLTHAAETVAETAKEIGSKVVRKATRKAKKAVSKRLATTKKRLAGASSAGKQQVAAAKARKKTAGTSTAKKAAKKATAKKTARKATASKAAAKKTPARKTA